MPFRRNPDFVEANRADHTLIATVRDFVFDSPSQLIHEVLQYEAAFRKMAVKALVHV